MLASTQVHHQTQQLLKPERHSRYADLRVSVGLSLGLLFGLGGLQGLLWCGVQDAGGIDQASVGVEFETETWKVKNLDVKVALGGDRLIKESTARWHVF